MRTYKPAKPEPMTATERKAWRAKWLDRLNQAGVPFFDLAGKTDQQIWQLKNKYFPGGYGGGGTMRTQEGIPRQPKIRLM